MFNSNSIKNGPKIIKTMCYVRPTFTGQNWSFKKCWGKYFKPAFWIDICINSIYLQYFYKIPHPSMFLYKTAILMLICVWKSVKHKATLTFRLVRTAFADLCPCTHGTTWKFVWTLTNVLWVLSLNFVKKTSLV